MAQEINHLTLSRERRAATFSAFASARCASWPCAVTVSALDADTRRVASGAAAPMPQIERAAERAQARGATERDLSMTGRCADPDRAARATGGRSVQPGPAGNRPGPGRVGRTAGRRPRRRAAGRRG